jgi:uncharacterized SAM-binding protein YcdF (DUF218 family)
VDKDIIERFPPLQHLSESQIVALTEIVFGPDCPTTQADIGFVFGGSHPGLWKTSIHAFRSHLIPRFIVTGCGIGRKHKHPDWFYGETPEARVIANKMIEAGVPEGVITIEDKSNNSLENVLFGIQHIDLTAISTILAISKSYATGRQLRTLRRHLLKDIHIQTLSFPADIADVNSVDRNNWARHPISIRFVLGEYSRNIRYGEQGDIVPVTPVPGVQISGC